MVDWKYLILAQYPAFLLLAVLFLVNYLRVRKSSAVKSMLWVLLFGAALAVSVLCLFLGIHYGYWTLRTLFPMGFASWLGVLLAAAAAIAHTVHVIEKKRSQKLMEKELKRAAKEKDDAVARAHEEGRRAAREEAEAMRLSRAAEAAGAEAAQSSLAHEAAEPIELKLEE